MIQQELIPNAWAVGDAAASFQLRALAFVTAAVHAREPVTQEQPEPTVVRPAAPAVAAAVSPPSTGTVGEGVPCGGSDLPPCWRVTIESRGTWNAYNPTGCSGTGCFGPYQFGGFWAGKLGLPGDLTTTTHDQWVNAARELWAGGTGCSNWAAC